MLYLIPLPGLDLWPCTSNSGGTDLAVALLLLLRHTPWHVPLPREDIPEPPRKGGRPGMGVEYGGTLLSQSHCFQARSVSVLPTLTQNALAHLCHQAQPYLLHDVKSLDPVLVGWCRSMPCLLCGSANVPTPSASTRTSAPADLLVWIVLSAYLEGNMICFDYNNKCIIFNTSAVNLMYEESAWILNKIHA